VLHASAVRTPIGIVGFCARSGSGKSTVAAGLRRRGFEQVADDALLLRLDEGHVTAQALPFCSRLRRASVDYFANAFGDEATPRVAIPGATGPLAALIVLNRDDGRASIALERVSPMRAFSAVLTHAHCFDLEDRPAVARLVSDYLDITRIVPVFECHYRSGWEHFPDLLDTILTAASSAA
jgi:hypothetical protein